MTAHRDRTHLTRQLDIIPLDCLDTPVTIIGAGAIGSWVALSLAKMGMENLTVYDDDAVSIENMNCQFYPFSAIGKKKAQALAEMVEQFTRVKINYKNEKYTGGKISGIVVCAVDSMSARKLVFENLAERSIHTQYVIDPRMGSQSALLLTYRPMDSKECEDYATSLYTDESAVQERCTAKATIYTANLLSGIVVKALKDFLLKGERLSYATWDIPTNQLVCFSVGGKPQVAAAG